MPEHCNKPLPEITWETIAPPYLDYPYFENVESFPFRPSARRFEMVNAWWLAEMSALVYAEPSFAGMWMDRAGFVDHRYFSGNSTQCYVADGGAFAVAAFRGTETRRRSREEGFEHVLADLMTDADVRLVSSGQGGRVHKGFRNALDEVWGDLLAHLQQLHATGRSLWFTGHSLGAALATLAADRFGDAQGLYTFGSPRVGDRAFAEDCDVDAYRFVNRHDVICRLPPSPPYEHVGELRFIDAEGTVRDTSRKWQEPAGRIRSEFRRLFNALGQRRHGFDRLIPEELKDHVPLLYAVHVFNALVEG